MKNFLNCFLLSGVFLLISCKKESNDTNRISFEGTWRIVLFTDHGNDETNDFSGYLFSFGNNGVLEASKSGRAKTGTWSYEGDEFNIDLGEKTDSNKPLGELTDDWELISQTSTEIKLKDDNDSSAEFLTFKKN
ncbi:MAG TPA: hypothetical protein PKV73_10665 [Agriterribacter sp.]|nr:hypothetical protein [Agriterribacter sp.]